MVLYGYHGTTRRIAAVWRARRLRLRSREPRAARGMWGRLVATVAARARVNLASARIASRSYQRPLLSPLFKLSYRRPLFAVVKRKGEKERHNTVHPYHSSTAYRRTTRSRSLSDVVIVWCCTWLYIFNESPRLYKKTYSGGASSLTGGTRGGASERQMGQRRIYE